MSRGFRTFTSYHTHFAFTILPEDTFTCWLQGLGSKPPILGSEDHFLPWSQPPYHPAICHERHSNSPTYGNTPDDLRPVKSPRLDSCHQILALKRWTWLLRKANMFLKTNSFTCSLVFLKNICRRQFELSVSECRSGVLLFIYLLETWGGFFHWSWIVNSTKLFHPGVKLLLVVVLGYIIYWH